MEAIGWDNLGTYVLFCDAADTTLNHSIDRMISGPSEEIRLEALSILRNVVFTSNNSQSITGLREMGEEKMLSLLETSMATGSDAVIEQVNFYRRQSTSLRKLQPVDLCMYRPFIP